MMELPNPVILGGLWVVAATITAFLPMRRQMAPGFVLLAAAPLIIWQMARVYGGWPAIFAVFCFVSMFRRPLYFLGRRALGLPTRRPDEGGPHA